MLLDGVLVSVGTAGGAVRGPLQTGCGLQARLCKFQLSGLKLTEPRRFDTVNTDQVAFFPFLMSIIKEQ